MTDPIIKEKEESRLVVLLISIFPSQKEELERLSEKTDRSIADLCREAITVLLGNYRNIGV